MTPGRYRGQPLAQIKMKTMKKNTSHTHEVGNLVEDAQALLVATAHLTEEKVAEARKRLANAVEKGKEAWETVQEKAVAGAKATDEAIHEHPYRAISVAFGIGALIGFLIRRRG
jgi:ElaB/YqjD/DUF883 family membrane-anchored ribosome-binding protein